MGIFGWSYPAGCSGPPEYPDPSPESEQVWAMLEEAGLDDPIIEGVCKIVEQLAEELARAKESCPTCERRAAEAEAESEKAAAEYWKSHRIL